MAAMRDELFERVCDVVPAWAHALCNDLVPSHELTIHPRYLKDGWANVILAAFLRKEVECQSNNTYTIRFPHPWSLDGGDVQGNCLALVVCAYSTPEGRYDDLTPDNARAFYVDPCSGRLMPANIRKRDW